MEIFLGWVIFSVIVGILADQRGRNGVGWGFLAAMISPLLSGIILFIIPNLKTEKEIKEKEERIKLTISGSDLLLSLEKLWQLNEKEIITDIEYSARKMKLIEDLEKRILSDSPENFLGALIPLLDKGILSKDEIEKIKQVVFKESTPEAGKLRT